MSRSGPFPGPGNGPGGGSGPFPGPGNGPGGPPGLISPRAGGLGSRGSLGPVCSPPVDPVPSELEALRSSLHGIQNSGKDPDMLLSTSPKDGKTAKEIIESAQTKLKQWKKLLSLYGVK